MTKHMQWEASRKTTQLGSTTVTEIELTPEGKKALTIDPVPYILASDKERAKMRAKAGNYAPRDYSRMPWPDRILFTLLGVVVGVVIGGVYLAWSAKGVP